MRGPQDRPFFLVASLTHPHDPFAVPQDYWDRYDHAAIDMPRLDRHDVALDPHTARLRHVSAMDAEPVTEAQVRNARHAYYSAISFCDDQLGKLIGALEATGLAENTVVMFLSDHGEMLGERGLWYKMTFLEGGARVPLIVAGPGISTGRRGEAVSLIDVLPTLIALAGGDPERDVASPVDGRSLLPHLTGGTGHDEVIGEYLAEGAVAPVVMLRRGPWKFIHAPGDPDQLYDLASDPGERLNRAEETDMAAIVAGFRQEVAERWNLPELDAAVRASQRRRRLVDAALMTGRTSAMGLPALHGCVAAIHAQHDRPRRSRGPRAVPAGEVIG